MDMHNSMSLYRMELRKNRSAFFIALALLLTYMFINYGIEITQYINHSSYIPNYIPVAGIFVLLGAVLTFPFMMIYSWYREEKSKTSYQMLLFPVRPHVILKNKVKALLSYGLVFLIVFQIHGLIMQYGLSTERWAETFKFRYLFGFVIRGFTLIVLLLGFAVLVIGVLKMVKKSRLLIGTGLMVLGPVLYYWSSKAYTSFYLEFFNKKLFRAFDTHSPLVQSFLGLLIGAIGGVFPLLIGLTCMYIGFYLFDRFSEV